MECKRLIKLIKSWYLAVQDESLAPARMVSFMQSHITNCDVCLTDLEVQHEVDKITEIILPPAKKTASKPNPKEETNPGDRSDHETNEDQSDHETNGDRSDHETNGDQSDHETNGDQSDHETNEDKDEDDHDSDYDEEIDNDF